MGRTQKTVLEQIREYAQCGLLSLLKVSSLGNNTLKISKKHWNEQLIICRYLDEYGLLYWNLLY